LIINSLIDGISYWELHLPEARTSRTVNLKSKVKLREERASKCRLLGQWVPSEGGIQVAQHPNGGKFGYV
jgi:hypothetical protein